MIDYNLKMEDILSDYFQMIDEFDLITSIILNNNFIIDDNDNAETIRKKNNQKKKVLQDLGRILELAFKYIIKLKRLKIYPNEPYESDSIKKIKGFKDKETFPKPVVNDLANKCHISQNQVDNKIFSINGIGPEAHNFSYLYKIIEVIFPQIDSSLKDFFGYILKSKMASKEIDDDLIKFQFITFPEEIFTESNKDKEQIDSETLERIQNRIKSINENGDIFTRLRYFANNPNDKKVNVDEIYELASDVVDFTKAIHLNNENLNLDSKLLFASFILSNNSFSRFTQDELKELINNKKVQQNPTILMDALFYCDLPYKDIEELLSLEQIDESEYTFLFTSGVTAKIISYFNKKGINDCEDIAYYTDRIKYANKELSKLEKYRKEKLNNDSNLNLINLISPSSLKIIQMFPDLFEDNEFIKNISYGYLVTKKQ